MKTATLVQIYTALTQVMAEKVNVGDNSEVPVFLDDGLNDPFPISGIHVETDEAGKITQVNIQTEFI